MINSWYQQAPSSATKGSEEKFSRQREWRARTSRDTMIRSRWWRMKKMRLSRLPPTMNTAKSLAHRVREIYRGHFAPPLIRVAPPV